MVTFQKPQPNNKNKLYKAKNGPVFFKFFFFIYLFLEGAVGKGLPSLVPSPLHSDLNLSNSI